MDSDGRPTQEETAARKQREIDAAWAERERLPWVASPERYAQRIRLAGQQNWRCCYCGGRMGMEPGDPCRATLEHIVPRAKGGSDHEDNLAVCCDRCNSRRGRAMWPEHMAVCAMSSRRRMLRNP